MFFDTYAALCAGVGKKPTTVALELGISKSTVSNWKKGGHTPHAAQLQKIADYFNVTVDSLLGKEKAPTAVQGDERDEPVTPAMDQHHERSMYGAKLLEELTPEKREEALRYLEFLKSQEMK